MTTLEQRIAAKLPGDDTGIAIRKSLCTICDPLTQCGLDCYVKDGRVIKVEGSDENPFNRGALCSKGAATRQYLYHENRLKTPLRRVGPRGSNRFEPISWDDAIGEIADKLLAAKQEHGPESVVFYAGYTKYFRPYLIRLAHVFGTPNYCSESSTCNMATGMAQRLVFSAPGAPDLANTDCLLVWSSNPFYTGHGRAQMIQKRLDQGMKMIVVDPRITPTTARADIHLQLRPGTDGALALAMANVIINENLYDHDFVDNYTHGFQAYRDYVRKFTPEEGERLTGVPAGKIQAAARLFAGAKTACVQPSASPVVHHTNGVQNSRAMFMLVALTGNYDVPGGNRAEPPSYLYVGAGFQTREHQFENPVPITSLPPRIGSERFPVWMETASPEAQAMALPDQLRSGQPYPLKALVGFGMNYRMWPDSEGFKKSLDNLDLVVNTDIFMTDTCRQADIVLPACTSLERMELRAYGPRYVMLSQPVVPALYESKSDVDMIFELAKRLCPEDDLFAKGYEGCIDWILEPSGITVSELKKHPGGMPVPHPLPMKDRKYEGGAATPSGKIEFQSTVLEKYGEKPGFEPLPVYTPPRNSPDGNPELAKEYPFVLNTGSRLPMFIHSRANHLTWTQNLRPNHPAADIHPDDATRQGIRQDDTIRLATPHGAIQVKANLTRMVLPGVVHMYHGSSLADANSLFDKDYLDPLSGFPGYKSALCRIEKIKEDQA